MTRRVVLVDEAEQQLKSIDQWWLANRRASPDLFIDELDQAIELLSELPDAARRYLARAAQFLKHKNEQKYVQQCF